MKPYWEKLHSVLLVVLVGVPGLDAWEQVTWTGPVKAGFSTTFTCSSSCLSNCTYTWHFLGHTVVGSTLTWKPDGRDSTVDLQCNILNPKTGISTSLTSIVEIKNLVSVQISPPNTVPSLSQSLNLVCFDETGSGPWKPVVWYKDGQQVILRKDLRVLRNALLHFDSLRPSDVGFYQCETQTFEQMSVMSLGYLLSFDPWNVSIRGPDVVYPGRLSKFICLVSCTINVDCTVKWKFGGGFPIGKSLSVHENELKWTPSIPGTFQNFTCAAENVAAQRFSEATKMVEVKGAIHSGSEAVQLNRLLTMISRLALLLILLSHVY